MHNPQSLSEMRALLATHRLEPKKALGQHFLADPNIVMKIVRTAGVGEGDQVLEVGPGTGTLTAALGSTGATVVAYEIDRTLEPVLSDTLADFPNVSVVFEDATELESGVLPGPGDWTMVANLPYNVGTPLVLSLLRTAPHIKRFVVMVQKEVADRFVAGPGSKTYGLPSVIVGLHTSSTGSFFVPPQVFFPPPNVGSAVITLDRKPASEYAELAVEIAASAFRKRRKMLRASLQGVFGDPAAVCVAADIAPTERPEDLSPDQFVALAQVATTFRTAKAHPKLNFSLEVFAPDETGLHPLKSVVQTLGVAETLLAGPSAASSDVFRLVNSDDSVPMGPENLVLRAVAALREAGASVPALRFVLNKTLPVAAGIGAGSADAAAALLLAAELGEVSADQLATAAAATGADVPVVMAGGIAVMEGYGERVRPLPFAEGFQLLVATPDVMVSTSEVYKEWDALGSPRGGERPLDALPSALRSLGPFRNDLEPAAISLVPELAEYRTRLESHFGVVFFFSGSGPTMFAFLAAGAQVDTSAKVASQLELRDLFVTEPNENGASVVDR